MSFSVNTNSNALAALQTLNLTQRSLSTTQAHINSGFKGGGAFTVISSLNRTSSTTVTVAQLQVTNQDLTTTGATLALSNLDVTTAAKTQATFTLGATPAIAVGDTFDLQNGSGQHFVFE